MEVGAASTGVSAPTYWRWGDGRTLPNLRQAVTLRDLYGIDPDAWLRPSLLASKRDLVPSLKYEPSVATQVSQPIICQ